MALKTFGHMHLNSSDDRFDALVERKGLTVWLSRGGHECGVPEPVRDVPSLRRTSWPAYLLYLLAKSGGFRAGPAHSARVCMLAQGVSHVFRPGNVFASCLKGFHALTSANNGGKEEQAQRIQSAASQATRTRTRTRTRTCPFALVARSDEEIEWQREAHPTQLSCFLK